MTSNPADAPTLSTATAPPSERELVLVTGGSGLIALHCIHQLLLSGFAVRATVRSAAKESNVTSAIKAALSDKELTPAEQLAASSSTADDLLKKISFAHVDLVKEDGWAEAVRGAKYILHVASPFPPVAPKNESELIKPAREGTLRVLRAAAAARSSADAAAGEIKPQRVVLTSSVAAVAYGTPVNGERMFTEADWTDDTKVKDYTRSKVLAERAAWDFMEKEGNAAGLELAVINPVGVFGPPLRPKDNSTTIDIVREMLAGKIPATPKIHFGSVDVRDVAALHLLAMTKAEAKGQRYLATGGPVAPFSEFARWLREGGLEDEFGKGVTRKVPTRELPTWLLSIAALVNPQVKGIRGQVGEIRNVTSDKAKTQLGWNPRSAKDSVVATARTLLRAKAV